MATAAEPIVQPRLFPVAGDNRASRCRVVHRMLKRSSQSKEYGISAARQLRFSGMGFFDADFNPEEQFPLRFIVWFKPVEKDGVSAIQLMYQGRQIGDILTDNAHVDDGYRFHDVFHFSHAAILRWSPMVRKLFGCKRKSVRQVDEVEDGARARILEEAVCAVVFEYARKRNFLAGATEVSAELIENVREITRNYEVGARLAADWERAILQGYDVWRQMRANGGGFLSADLEERTIWYTPDEPDPVM